MSLIYVRILPEFGTNPVWPCAEEGATPGNVAPFELPISVELASDLFRWDSEYQAIYDDDDPPNSAFPNEAAEAAFAARGLELSRRLARELPGVEIRYWDVSTNRETQIIA
jgi:hypothetical protein